MIERAIFHASLFRGTLLTGVDGMIGAVRRINPGALHRANEFTVALLEVGTGEVRFLPVPR